MTAVVEVRGPHQALRPGSPPSTTSTFTLEENRIYGLLGRNGAGKTTLMQLLTGQDFATARQIEVFGESPVENADVLAADLLHQGEPEVPGRLPGASTCSQPRRGSSRTGTRTSPTGWSTTSGCRSTAGSRSSPAASSRPSASSSASPRRAPLTFFDEPYLGLDAVARQIFYDRLLADYAEHPRTVVLSTHLIDEVSDLLEHVLVIDDGRILIDQDADDAARLAPRRSSARRTAVDAFVAGREVLHREGIGGLASATVAGLERRGSPRRRRRRARARAGVAAAARRAQHHHAETIEESIMTTLTPAHPTSTRVARIRQRRASQRHEPVDDADPAVDHPGRDPAAEHRHLGAHHRRSGPADRPARRRVPVERRRVLRLHLHAHRGDADRSTSPSRSRSVTASPAATSTSAARVTFVGAAPDVRDRDDDPRPDRAGDRGLGPGRPHVHADLLRNGPTPGTRSCGCSSADCCSRSSADPCSPRSGCVGRPSASLPACLCSASCCWAFGAIAVYTGTEKEVAQAVIDLGPVGIASWSLVHQRRVRAPRLPIVAARDAPRLTQLPPSSSNAVSCSPSGPSTRALSEFHGVRVGGATERRPRDRVHGPVAPTASSTSSASRTRSGNGCATGRPTSTVVDELDLSRVGEFEGRRLDPEDHDTGVRRRRRTTRARAVPSASR